MTVKSDQTDAYRMTAQPALRVAAEIGDDFLGGHSVRVYLV